MKMTAEHYQKLDAAIKRLAAKHEDWPAALRNTLANYQRNPKIQDADKALRWKVLHVALSGDEGSALWSALYAYLNDSHIDTALRSLAEDNNSPLAKDNPL